MKLKSSQDTTKVY